MTDFLEIYGRQIAQAAGTHLYYVLLSVAIAFALSLILGILLSRAPRWANIILPVLSLFQTVPGIVFIGLLFLAIGIVPATIIIALAIYAIFPILKNTYVGIIEVDESYREAAKGCGMSALQALMRVELPLALPAIISGLRMSLVYTVSWAVLAAMIGLGGLGDLIFAGISSNNNVLILAGALPAALMAILCSLGIDLLRGLLIPRPLRRDVL
jgi:osmoprotectant transport system permease protein